MIDGIIAARATGGVPGSRVILDGDVRLLQRDSVPFPWAGIYTPYARSKVANLDDIIMIEDLCISRLMGAVRSRNRECNARPGLTHSMRASPHRLTLSFSRLISCAVTMSYDVPLPVWYAEDAYVPSTSPTASLTSALALQPRSFQVEMVARIPPAPILVRPGVSQEIKHGWIQYMSFLPITLVLAWIFRYVIFRWRVIDTLVVDTPRSLKVD